MENPLNRPIFRDTLHQLTCLQELEVMQFCAPDAFVSQVDPEYLNALEAAKGALFTEEDLDASSAAYEAYVATPSYADDRYSPEATAAERAFRRRIIEAVGQVGSYRLCDLGLSVYVGEPQNLVLRAEAGSEATANPEDKTPTPAIFLEAGDYPIDENFNSAFMVKKTLGEWDEDTAETIGSDLEITKEDEEVLRGTIGRLRNILSRMSDIDRTV